MRGKRACSERISLGSNWGSTEDTKPKRTRPISPRPHALAHDRHYAALLPDYGARFAVLPGLTGLAQASGLHGEIHQLGCMARRVQADVAYAAGWSFRDDLILLGRTVPVVLARLTAD